MSMLAGQGVTCALFLALSACMAGQVVHGYLRIMHSVPRARRSVAAYEGALLVHLGIMAACALGNLRTPEPADALLFGNTAAEPPAFLWANIAIAAFAAYFAITDYDETGESDSLRWMPPVEAVVALACSPAVLTALGDLVGAAVLADLAYFAGRTAYLLFCDRKNRFKIVSPLSLAEALQRLPEGILYADEQGRTVIANDAMRRCLAHLGISANAGMQAMWRELNELSRGPRAVRAVEDLGWEPGSWVVLRMDEGEVRVFSFEGPGFEGMRHYPGARPLGLSEAQERAARSIFGKVPSSRIIAYDISEEIAALEEIRRMNAELSAAQAELRASADTVREAAENEAMLRMRGRVHDVIGQRLSILHRALEDNSISDEKLDQLKPLLNGIMDDLTANVHASSSDELSATVATFALSGVSIEVHGTLPEDELRSRLFVDCVREAATNAVKHARARVVTVSLGPRTLAIGNDGMQPQAPIVEGTGLANMRRSIEAEGGIFEIRTDPFELRASFP